MINPEFESVTLEEAKNLQHGNILHIPKNPLLSKGKRCFNWRVNGKVKTWKRSPHKVQVPLKYGLYDYDYLTESNLTIFHLESKCPHLS